MIKTNPSVDPEIFRKNQKKKQKYKPQSECELDIGVCYWLLCEVSSSCNPHHHHNCKLALHCCALRKSDWYCLCEYVAPRSWGVHWVKQIYSVVCTMMETMLMIMSMTRHPSVTERICTARYMSFRWTCACFESLDLSTRIEGRVVQQRKCDGSSMAEWLGTKAVAFV